MSLKVRVLSMVYRREDDLAYSGPSYFKVAEFSASNGTDSVDVEIYHYVIYGVYPRGGFVWRGTTTVEWPLWGVYDYHEPSSRPPYHPALVDNITPATAGILELQAKELRGLGQEFDIIWWNHLRHCYPCVAENLKKWFKHSVLWFADDAPGSSERKSLPVSRYFDSAVHGNIIANKGIGLLTKDFYHGQGVIDTHYNCLPTSGGLNEGLKDIGFSFEEKVSRLRAGQFPLLDFVFVGPPFGERRIDLVRSIDLFKSAGLNVQLYGPTMPAGVIGQYYRPSFPPKTVSELVTGGPTIYAQGYDLAPLYSQSFCGATIPVYGLMGTRVHDYWTAGVLNFMQDSPLELREIGVVPGEHFMEYDGTTQGLLGAILAAKKSPSAVADILEKGRNHMIYLQTKFSAQAALERIIFSNLHKWGTE